MPASIPQLSLLWAALFSLLSSVAAKLPQYPTTLELDIVFPRNDTYAPVDAFPFVAVIQNNFLSEFLEFEMVLLWVLSHVVDNESVSIESGSFAIDSLDYDDPRYLVSATTKLNSTEGQFELYWKLEVDNCSIANFSANGTANVDNLYASYSNRTHFTLQNAAQPPDLVAATGPDTCASTVAVVLNVTGYTPPPILSIPGLSPREQRQCPVIRNATVSPTPCSVRLNQTQAASISASATAVACDTWHMYYPDRYKAVCEREPESAASLLNTATVQAGVWVALSLSFIFTYVF
ncbi:hypothetical protein F4860DRAFT_494127 [Xylaria cubensis]|nr:hypothetical protein F4860DRAFT_494127 [Xylaria cubensis]